MNELPTIEIDESTPPPLPEQETVSMNGADEFSVEDLQSEDKPEAPAMTPDEAFVKSHAHTFNEELLHPFTPDRQNAAQAMGMEIFNQSEEFWESFRERQTYDGIYRDAKYAVWLCTQSEGNVAKWEANTRQARLIANQWLNQHNAGLGTELHAEILEIFGDFLQEIFASTSVPDETGGGVDPIDAGKSLTADGQNTATSSLKEVEEP